MASEWSCFLPIWLEACLRETLSRVHCFGMYCYISLNPLNARTISLLSSIYESMKTFKIEKVISPKTYRFRVKNKTKRLHLKTLSGRNVYIHITILACISKGLNSTKLLDIKYKTKGTSWQDFAMFNGQTSTSTQLLGNSRIFNSHFHEGFFTSKGLREVLAGLEKIWAETKRIL